MQVLAKKSAVQYGLIVALLLALTCGVLTPAGAARATGQLATGGSGTPVAVGTPAALAPPAPPTLPEPAAAPAPTEPAPATPQSATPTFASRPGPASTPLATPQTLTPVSITPTMRVVPTITPTPLPYGTISAVVSRDLSPLAFTLTGRSQDAESTLAIDVSDTAPTVRQPGWSLSLTIEQFRVAANPTRTLPDDAVTLLGVAVRCIGEAACTVPENTVVYPLTIPAGVAMPIYRAAPGSGSGQFVVTPTFAITVPGNAAIGNYATTIVVAITR